MHSTHQGGFSRKPDFVCDFRRCVLHTSQCVDVLSVYILCTTTLDGGGILLIFSYSDLTV